MSDVIMRLDVLMGFCTGFEDCLRLNTRVRFW